nr:FAD-dependent oxidoreductase [Gammaproteobacteria bacterium]
HTKEGDICCEHVVNAAGYRVNEVGRMLGVVHPITSMEHMYFLTDPMPELQALDYRVPIIRDPGDDFYSRQEKEGLLVGVYEQRCKPFGLDGIDPSFTQSLCPSDLDRCLDNMERIFERLPALAETGIHTVINGPITYTIDGAPLIGPIPGLTNGWCAIGLRAGIGESGGHGKILAELMVHGECEWDAWFLDPRRFTGHANTEVTNLKAIEDYQNEFHYHLPHEHRPAARLARTTPLYTTLDQHHCEWGVVNGWERALFFKPDPSFEDIPGYRFTATQDIVAAEVRGVRDHVGVMEVSGFTRYDLQGAGTTEFLNRLVCGRIPTETGRVSLCYLLTEKGNVLSEATVAKLGDDHYWYGCAAAAEWHDRDWLLAHAPATMSLTNLSTTHTTLVVAGPDSRALLQSLSPRSDWSRESLPWMRCKHMFVGYAEVMAMSISFSGELAYELHIPNEQLLLVWSQITDAGTEFQLVNFGLYATESMRLEKGYRHWKADLIYEFNPIESCLERFVDLDKTDFIGKAGLQRQLQNGMRKRFVSMTVECDAGPAHAGSPIFAGDQQVGSVTSGGYGFRVEKNIAFGFVEPTMAEPDTQLTVGILGQRHQAIVQDPALYDPENLRVRQ